MATRELWRSDKLNILPETRFCTKPFSNFNPIPHGPEFRSVSAVFIAEVSAPDTFTEQQWETVKGCAVVAGGLGLAAAIAIVTATEGAGWPAAVEAFGVAFLGSFNACVAAKFAADLAIMIAANLKDDKEKGAWTHH
jgi:hypothetical protein